VSLVQICLDGSYDPYFLDVTHSFYLFSEMGCSQENTDLLSRNTAFYLEMAIQRFLQSENTGSLPKKLHESCFILLNAIIETASSRAYYLREHLIRSRKIV
jgi:hypothetical protein